jgi:glutathione peroxidase
MNYLKQFGLFATLFVLFTAFVADNSKTVYEFTVEDITGKKVNLSAYKGKTLLIVNVASKCGLTPQYEDLQALYEKYKDKTQVVLFYEPDISSETSLCLYGTPDIRKKLSHLKLLLK